jgi:hypothetical protein
MSTIDILSYDDVEATSDTLGAHEIYSKHEYANFICAEKHD